MSAPHTVTLPEQKCALGTISRKPLRDVFPQLFPGHPRVLGFCFCFLTLFFFSSSFFLFLAESETLPVYQPNQKRAGNFHFCTLIATVTHSGMLLIGFLFFSCAKGRGLSLGSAFEHVRHFVSEARGEQRDGGRSLPPGLFPDHLQPGTKHHRSVLDGSSG